MGKGRGGYVGKEEGRRCREEGGEEMYGRGRGGEVGKGRGGEEM